MAGNAGLRLGSRPILDDAEGIRRFDETNRLDHMPQQQHLTTEHVNELAHCIAGSHGRLQGAERPKIDSFESDATRPVIAPMRANSLEQLSREPVVAWDNTASTPIESLIARWH